MDILTKIHNKISTFSKGKQRIARYLLESCEQAAFQTAGVIGKTVQVSESTVVRFAVDLGYEGYPEMQKALQEVVRARLSNAPQTEDRSAHGEDFFSTVLQSHIQQLRSAMEKVDRRAFEGAVEALLQARRIYILGVGAEAPLASALDYELALIFEDVRCVTDGVDRDVLRWLVHMSPRDVLFCIGSSSKAMEFAQQMGAQTVLLTNDGSEQADHVLCVPWEDSQVASISVINALIAAVHTRRRQETAETWERLKEIWDVYHV